MESSRSALSSVPVAVFPQMWSYQCCRWVSDSVMVCGGWLPDGLVLKHSTNMSTVSPCSLAPSQTGADPAVNLLLTWVCVERNEQVFLSCLTTKWERILPQCCCGISHNLSLTFTRITLFLVSACYLYYLSSVKHKIRYFWKFWGLYFPKLK